MSTSVSRRGALGRLVGVGAAGLLGLAPIELALADQPTTCTIDRIEDLLAEAEALALQLDERDRNNISQEFERLAIVLPGIDPIGAAAAWPRETGSNRVMDRVDRREVM